jgi:hypothetical protein
MFGTKILDGQSDSVYEKEEGFIGFGRLAYVGIEQRQLIPFTKPRAFAIVAEAWFQSGGNTEVAFNKYHRFSPRRLQQQIDAIIKKHGEVEPMSDSLLRTAAGTDADQVRDMRTDHAARRLVVYREAQKAFAKLGID